VEEDIGGGLPELTEQELDISMAVGFLNEWLKDAPQAVKDNLKVLSDGVKFYREKYTDTLDDYTTLSVRYSDLTSLSAGYLELIRQQRDQIDQQLIESQREFHKDENNLE
jgi:hypothetical protein